MAAITRILERLKQRPELAYRLSESMITVDPCTSDGFAVALTESPGEWIVYFEGWHEHFQSEEEAIRCFIYGLSDRCRLRVDYRGSFAHRWTLEERTNNGWREESTTGLLLFPFWRRSHTEYLRNFVIVET